MSKMLNMCIGRDTDMPSVMDHRAVQHLLTSEEFQYDAFSGMSELYQSLAVAYRKVMDPFVNGAIGITSLPAIGIYAPTILPAFTRSIINLELAAKNATKQIDDVVRVTTVFEYFLFAHTLGGDNHNVVAADYCLNNFIANHVLMQEEKVIDSILQSLHRLIIPGYDMFTSDDMETIENIFEYGRTCCQAAHQSGMSAQLPGMTAKAVAHLSAWAWEHHVVNPILNITDPFTLLNRVRQQYIENLYETKNIVNVEDQQRIMQYILSMDRSVEIGHLAEAQAEVMAALLSSERLHSFKRYHIRLSNDHRWMDIAIHDDYISYFRVNELDAIVLLEELLHTQSPEQPALQRMMTDMSLRLNHIHMYNAHQDSEYNEILRTLKIDF